MAKEPIPNAIALRNLCILVIISQGFKAVLDWLRLFDDLSFYVTLIIRTIIDIKWISFIIVVIFVYIGNSMYMLQLNTKNGEDTEIIHPIFDNFFFDLMINQF